LATAGWDGFLRLYEVPSGKQLPPLPRQPGEVHGVWFSADGKLASAGVVIPGRAGETKDGFARVWDVAARKQLHSFPMPEGSTPTAALSPDGRLLAAGNTRGGLRVWDLQTGRERLLEPGEPHTALSSQRRSVACAALAPDGKTLATGGWDSRVSLWDLDAAA